MKTIVVLGVGLSSVLVIRQIMRTKVLGSKDYKMVVVSPNEHFHWALGMPRAVVPGQFTDDKIIYPLEPSFKQYPADKFEFIVGAASSLEPGANTIVVSPNAGGSRSIPYDVLVIGTGASSPEGMPWKALDSTEKTVEAIHKVQEEIKAAKTIVIAGGGFTGVETAGELGFEYSQNGKKEVYFIHDQAMPLSPRALDSVRKASANELERLKVKIIPNTKVGKVTRSGKDYVLDLQNSNGTTKTLTAQAYLSATGLTPNSAFAPASMLDNHGYIKQNTFLNAQGYKNIFVIGDVGSLEPAQALYAERQAVHLISALPLYLDGAAIPEYKPDPKPLFAATTGRSRGTGQMGGIKMFSFLVWFLKGRFLGTNYAGEYAKGKRSMQKTFEK